MKKRNFCFHIIFLFFSISTLAQDTQRADSLLYVYENADTPDTTKVNTLGRLCSVYMYSDQEKANGYITASIQLAEKIGFEKGVAKSYLSKGILYEIMGELDSSKFFYAKTLDYYEKNENRHALELTRFNIAQVDVFQGNYDNAIDLVNKSIQAPEPQSNQLKISRAMSLGLLSRVYRLKGYNQLALTNALSALEYLETAGDELRIADALKDLANTESFMKNYQKSNEYFERAQTIYEKHNDNFYLTAVKSDMGSNYIQLGDFPNATKILNEGIKLAKETGNLSVELQLILNLGKASMEEGDYSQAKTHFEQGMTICKETDFSGTLPDVQLLMGKLYEKMGQASKALPYYDQSITTTQKNGEKTALQDAHYSRASALTTLGEHALALEDYKAFQIINDSIFNAKKINAIEELRITHDIEQKEKEIEILAKNAELDKVKRGRLLMGLAAAIGIGSLLIWSQWQRRRKEKLLHQKEQEIQKEKTRVSELENQRLNQELDFKKQELTSKVLQLCRKNEFLQSLEKEVQEFKSGFQGESKFQLDKLSRKINRDMDADADWDQFLKSFESVHPEFIKSLTRKYPNLAPNEIRMACFMRMNLESKDIANLLNITPDGVKKARYRMRKKMEKDSSINLTEYFIHFGMAKGETS